MEASNIHNDFYSDVDHHIQPKNMEDRRLQFKKDYEYGKGLGSGAEGNVRRMKERPNGRLYAVKKMEQKFQRSGRPRPPNEIQILYILQNTGTGEGINTIVKFLDWFPCTPKPHLQQVKMPYCRLGSLFSWMTDKCFQPQGRWNAPHEAQMRHIYMSIMKGLAFLHFGYGTTLFNPTTCRITGRNPVLHRDIKPENILLSPTPSDRHHSLPTVQIGDFGGAMEIGMPKDDDLYFFTPEYAAPEFTKSNSQLTRDNANQASDVWAAGATIHWCLFGRTPYLPAPRGKLLRFDPRIIVGLEMRGGKKFTWEFGQCVVAALRSVNGRLDALQILELLGGDHDAHIAAYMDWMTEMETRERRKMIRRLHAELFSYHLQRALEMDLD